MKKQQNNKEFDYSKVIKPRAGSPYYYVHLKTEDGKLVRISTHESDYKKACIYYDIHYRKDSDAKIPTFGELFHLYTSHATNPRYLSARENGGRYGLERAKHVASDCRLIERPLWEKLPTVMRTPINMITRRDVKMMKEIVIDVKGRRRCAQALFQDIKAMFTQALEDCLIEVNPAFGLKNITYTKKVVSTYPVEFITKLLALGDVVKEENKAEQWAFVLLIATTGMRRSEALALDTSQLKPGRIIVIDRAVKSTNKDDIGLPKCDVQRAIVVSRTTVEVLKSTGVIRGRVFDHGRDWTLRAGKYIEKIYTSTYGEECNIAFHKFRHTLHSLLLGEDDLNITYIQQYFGWGHQLLLDSQRGYTHFYTKNYEKIADRIDDLITGKKSPCQQDKGDSEFILENWN